jgi:hypothetical protein
MTTRTRIKPIGRRKLRGAFRREKIRRLDMMKFYNVLRMPAQKYSFG